MVFKEGVREDKIRLLEVRESPLNEFIKLKESFKINYLDYIADSVVDFTESTG